MPTFPDATREERDFWDRIYHHYLVKDKYAPESYADSALTKRRERFGIPADEASEPPEARASRFDHL